MYQLVTVFSLIFLVGASAACEQIKLETPDRKNFIGSDYTQKKLEHFITLGLNPNAIFRPTTNARLHGKILETNPHFNNVIVCKGHQTKIYVGIFPYITMPDLRGLTVQLAEEKLRKAVAHRVLNGINPGDIKLLMRGSGTISRQTPEPGQWLYVDLLSNGRTVPRLVDTGKLIQHVVVESQPEVCPQCQRCESCKPPTSSPEPPASTSKTIVASVAGTLGASTVLIYALGGPSNVVNSLVQRGIVQPVYAPTAPLAAARVRRYRLRLKRAP